MRGGGRSSSAFREGKSTWDLQALGDEKNVPGGGGSSTESTRSSAEGSARGNGVNVSGAFLTACKSQTSSSAASRLAVASSSPFHTFTHWNHQLILLHLMFMRVSIFFFSLPRFNTSQYIKLPMFCRRRCPRWTLVTSVYREPRST